MAGEAGTVVETDAVVTLTGSNVGQGRGGQGQIISFHNLSLSVNLT